MVLSDETIKVIDEMFREAQSFFDYGDYVHSYEKYDDIKRYVRRIQEMAVTKVRGQVTAGGAILGLFVPGIGNLAGAVIGGILGHFGGGFLGFQSFCENGTIEEIVEVATTGKQLAKAAKYRSVHPETSSAAPLRNIESVYTRWTVIRKEVLNV